MSHRANWVFTLTEFTPINWEEIRSELEQISPDKLYRKMSSQWRTDRRGEAQLHLLHKVCSYYDAPIDLVKGVIRNDKECLKSFDNHGWSILHRACEGGNPKIISLVLKAYLRGARMWSCGRFVSYLPIHVYLRSTECPRLEVVKMLLNAYPSSSNESSKMRYTGFDTLGLVCERWGDIIKQKKVLCLDQKEAAEEECMKW